MFSIINTLNELRYNGFKKETIKLRKVLLSACGFSLDLERENFGYHLSQLKIYPSEIYFCKSGSKHKCECKKAGLFLSIACLFCLKLTFF